MQTSKFLALVALSTASVISVAQTTTSNVAPFPSSVATVEKLLKAENNALSGVDVATSAKANPIQTPVAPTLRVSSIYGTQGALRATVNFNGAEYENLRVGGIVGSYKVISIAGKCVTLAPAKQSKKKKNGISDCWTGFAPMNPSLMSSGEMVFGTPRTGVGAPLLPQGLPSGLTPAPLSSVEK